MTTSIVIQRIGRGKKRLPPKPATNAQLAGILRFMLDEAQAMLGSQVVDGRIVTEDDLARLDALADMLENLG